MTVTLNIYLLFNNSAYAEGDSANSEIKSGHSFFSGSNLLLTLYYNDMHDSRIICIFLICAC